MKRKTAVKKLMSLGVPRNQAEILLGNKKAWESNKGRLISIAHTMCVFVEFGLPISMLQGVMSIKSPSPQELGLEVFIG
jgi:hypothetical protein